MKLIRIAIDGYSSTGKSTMARELARKINYRYIDTGAMYRALTFWAQEEKFVLGSQVDINGLIESLPKVALDFRFNKASQQSEIHLNGTNIESEIRSPKVAGMVSEVAQISELRKFLVAQQRNIAAEGAVVMDGRDIASVVMPDAELKIFMTASPEIRAQRRHAELLGKGIENESFESVQANLAHRDHLDTSRKDSPLIQTKDAKVLDNSEIGISDQLAIALSWVNEIRKVN
jgi:cytidylate kinase